MLGLLTSCAQLPYYSNLPLTPSRAIAAAEDALRRGEWATAVSGFTDYLVTGQETFRARALFQLAQAQSGMENYEGALATLDEFDAEFPGRGAQVPTLRGDIHYAMGRRVEAIVDWDHAWQVGSDSDRVYIRQRITEASAELTPAERDTLAGDVSDPAVRGVLGLGPANELGAAPLTAPAATGAAAAESEADAAAGYAAMENAALPPADLAAGDALAAGVRVACLLPLTGPDRAAGQQALTGLRRAFAGDDRALLVRDTGGQADLAARLAAAIADEPTVIGLIGALRDETAAAVAPLAERLQMPTLLLASAAGLSGPYVLEAAPAGGAGSGPEAEAYEAGMRVRQAIAGGARSRGALLAALRQPTLP